MRLVWAEPRSPDNNNMQLARYVSEGRSCQGASVSPSVNRKGLSPHLSIYMTMSEATNKPTERNENDFYNCRAHP